MAQRIVLCDGPPN